MSDPAHYLAAANNGTREARVSLDRRALKDWAGAKVSEYAEPQDVMRYNIGQSNLKSDGSGSVTRIPAWSNPRNYLQSYLEELSKKVGS